MLGLVCGLQDKEYKIWLQKVPLDNLLWEIITLTELKSYNIARGNNGDPWLARMKLASDMMLKRLRGDN